MRWTRAASRTPSSGWAWCSSPSPRTARLSGKERNPSDCITMEHDSYTDVGGIAVMTSKRDHRFEPMFRHFNIGVQKYHIFRFDLLQSQIISIRKAMILIEHNDSDTRKFFPEYLHRSIRRAIVGYTDFYLPALRIADHRRKKSTKHIAPVPIQNNYRYFHHHPLSHSALEAFQRLCDHSQ